CGGACKIHPKCFIFTWDRIHRNCSLLDPLQQPFTTEAAPTTLRTYTSTTPFGKRIFRTPNFVSWTSANASCTSQGGRLHIPPDITAAQYCRLLYSVDVYWIGVHRLTTSSSWLDMNGQVYIPNLTWYPGEPNNLSGQYFMIVYYGNIADVADTYGNYIGVCEV
ncbi:hypothetical protein SK128_009388, partial [Halocaridina rubra]